MSCSSARRGGICCSCSRCAIGMGRRSHVWVTFDKSDARSLLRDERVVFAYGPTNRNVKNLLRNSRLSRGGRSRAVTPSRDSDDRRRGRRAVRMARASQWRARRVRRELHAHRRAVPELPADPPVADRVYVQWPELASAVPDARYVGNVFSSDDLRHGRHQRGAVRPALARCIDLRRDEELVVQHGPSPCGAGTPGRRVPAVRRASPTMCAERVRWSCTPESAR